MLRIPRPCLRENLEAAQERKIQEDCPVALRNTSRFGVILTGTPGPERQRFP